MENLQTGLLTACVFVYLAVAAQATPQFAPWRNQVSFQPSVLERSNQQKSEKVKVPSISITITSSKLERQTSAVVKLRIENTSGTNLSLSEPSSFYLKKSEGNDSLRVMNGYTASARLWECLPKALDENGILSPGEAFECGVDLKKLNWKLTKSSVDVSAPVYPVGDLFHEVPGGRYFLFFSLQSPQELIEGLPRVREFRSNEISVSIEK